MRYLAIWSATRTAFTAQRSYVGYRAMGIRDKPIAPGSPWQNGYAERLIGTIRPKCVDHLIVS